MFTKEQMKVIQFCAEEVDRQRAGPLAVGWMVGAWEEAHRKTRPYKNMVPLLSVADIEDFGVRVEPRKNKGGFRRVPIRVGSDVIPIHWELVPRMLKNLLDEQTSITPEEFYKRYEEIHPFVDGNGRTGKILYNWLKGTLEDPQMPPNFWGCSNP